MHEGKDELSIQNQKRMEGLLAKMEASRGKDIIAEDMAQLTKKLKVVEACRELVNLMTQPPDPRQFLELIAAFQDADVVIQITFI